MSSTKPGWKEIPIAGIPFKSALEYKTGTWRSFKPIIDDKKCVRCLLCWLYCPDDSFIIKWSEDGKRPKQVLVNYEYCKGCGICSTVCPTKAITMIPEGEEQ
ncbi:MAG: 4Fe-4S binding protein [Candidatus Njordarchaeia archaeon]|nr:4Fe-4S binding protein [Candidatus Korarchaeota archaeon]